MKRRHFILLLGGGSSGALSVGTGAFSSVEAERDVEVSVVEDENAYLGLEQVADSVPENEETNVVRIQNQFAAPLSLTVIVDEADEGIDEIDVGDDVVSIVEEEDDESDDDEGDEDDNDDDDDDGALSPGEKAYVSVECNEPGESISAKLRFSGDAGGASVDKTRKFSVRCIGEETDVTSSVTKVRFVGGSEQVRILTTENNGGGGGSSGTVSAKLYCEDDDGNVSSSDGFEDVSVNENLEIDDFDDDDLSGTIVGVEIEGIDGVYVKPDNAGEGSGNGNAVEDTTQDPDWD